MLFFIVSLHIIGKSSATTFKTHKVIFHWKIHNWPTIYELGVNFESTKFKLEHTDQKFFFTVELERPMALLEPVSRLLMLNIEVKRDSIVSEVRAFIIDKLTSTGVNLKYLHSSKNTYNLDNKPYETTTYEIPYQIDEAKYLSKGTVEFCCDVTYIEKSNISEVIEKPPSVHLYEKLVQSNHGSLYRHQKLCDVTFLVGKKDIKAHKCVLAAASPYFLTMFTNGNNAQEAHYFEDLSKDPYLTPEIFEAFLDYVYGLKSIADSSDRVKELLVLADEYGMKDLQIGCEAFLANHLTKTDVTALHLFAMKYNLVMLKKKAIEFMMSHVDDEDWPDTEAMISEDFLNLLERPRYSYEGKT